MSTGSAQPVLIVGAGPTGLVLALVLAQNGVPVRIIDKSIAPRIGQRGAGIQPRTLELYSIAGILPAILNNGAMTLPEARLYKTGSIEPVKTVPLFLTLEPSPKLLYTAPMLLSQERHEAVLREVLTGYNIRVEMGTELHTLEQDGEGVTARLEKSAVVEGSLGTEAVTNKERETARFRYVVGADGARGAVRKLLGLTFLGETTAEHMVVTDIRVEGLQGYFWHGWSNAAQTANIVMRPSETPNVFQAVVLGSDLGSLPEKEKVDPAYLAGNPDALTRWIHQMIGREEIKVTSIIWAAPYTVNVRMSDKFSKGRVFLAGDAAHIHSPTGGQGLNSGVQDSINLGWKLALVTKGLAPAALLDSYGAERQPVIDHMLNITTELLGKTAAHIDGTFNRGTHFLMLGVNYRRSALAVADGETHAEAAAAAETSPYYGGEGLRAGDRAPQAPGLLREGKETSFFEVMKLDRHTAFVFVGAAAGAGLDVGKLLDGFPPGTVQRIAVVPRGKAGVEVVGADAVLEDAQGHAFEGYAVDAAGDVRVVLVRPDGYIGALVGGIEGIKKYRQAVFGV